MYFMGILTTLGLQAWAFLEFFSRDPNEVDGPLKI
jgi:hypothetical protein